MKLNLFFKLCVLLLLLPLFAQSFAKGKGNSNGNALQKTLGSPSTTKFNINSISTFIYNDGTADVNGSNPGYYFPALGGNTACFQSGFLFGGYVGNVSDNQLRVGGSVYRTSLTPGRILADGITPANPTASDVRIYRVRPDYLTGSLSKEILDEGKSEQAIRTQYGLDWAQWPADQGAPFTYGKDATGNQRTSGAYDPNYDIPGVAGADQTIWFVANDFNGIQAQTFYGTQSLGVEVQCTVWGYNQSGALGNMLFKKYILINKNLDHKDFNQFYVSYWQDVDIGGGSYDFSGCDTTRSLFYTFSGIANNAEYGLTPPATGVDFMQGPRIKTGIATDTAIFRGKYITGYKNLPMTSDYYFINCVGCLYADPNQNAAIGTTEWYNLFLGEIASTGQPFTDPTTNLPSKFPLYGDPVAKTGWLDNILNAPGDRRNGGVSGPFTLAYGDTQEVVIAEMSAGDTPGTDNLGAITALKNEDDIAQIAYNRLFQLPAPAPAPKLQISEFDQKLLLNWGWNNSAVTATETYNSVGYAFQGYNVYQLPSVSATMSQAKKLHTYDIKDGITSITDLATDPTSGLLLPVVVQNGTDSGISRLLLDSIDVFTNNKFLDGSQYYFAVTSYSYNPNPPFGAKVLENPIAIIKASPHSNAPGVVYNAKIGDSLSVTRVSGIADGSVTVKVIDPSKVTGDNYKVSYDNVSGKILWKLTDVTINKVLLSNQPQSQGTASPTVDGLRVQVDGPAPAIKFNATNEAAGMVETAYAGTLLTSAQYDAAGKQFNGNSVWHSLNSAQPQRYYVGAGGGDGSLSRLTRSIANAVPYDYAIKITDTTAADNDWAYWGFDTGLIGKVPFQLWRYDPATKDSVRLIPILYTGGGGNEGHFAVKNTDVALGYPATDWIYWYFDSNGYDKFAAACIAGDVATADNFGEVEYFSRMIFGDYDKDGKIAPKGTVVKIYTTKPSTTNDAFSFTAPTVGYNADQAKADIEKINVYPNPYYGVNPQELDKYSRWVTFTHLPTKAIIRIYNLAGQLVRTIQKNVVGQDQRWDLLTDNGFPVASGLYIVYVDMPDLGKSKILKVAVIQEQQILDRF